MKLCTVFLNENAPKTAKNPVKIGIIGITKALEPITKVVFGLRYEKITITTSRKAYTNQAARGT